MTDVNLWEIEALWKRLE